MTLTTSIDMSKLDLSQSQKIDKNVLAMDSLSKLAKQFNENPDLEKLTLNLLYTLSGQFAVNNAFIIILQPGEDSFEQSFYGIGKYKDNSLLQSIEITNVHIEYFMKNNSPQSVDNIVMENKSSNLNFKLIESDVHIVTPLIVNDQFLGLIGLGEKVTKKEFSQEDFEVLEAIVNSITPFVANTFLFVEISNLNSWYLEILNNVKNGVFVFDSNLYLKSINDTGFNILKKFKSKIQNKHSLYNVSVDYIFTDAIFPGWATRIKKVITHKNSDIFENIKAGSEDLDHIFTVSLKQIKRQSELESDIIVTIDDVTNQKNSEQRMFELEKFAEKGVMASSIAHELNNFLGMLLGGVELTTIHHGKGNTEKISGYLEKLKDNIIKMQRFTAGLMDYTKLNTEKSIAKLNVIIEDVISFLTVQKRFSGIRIKTELLPQLSTLEIDTDQIAQLLLNFFNNSADAIKEKKCLTGQITIKTKQEDNFIIMSIEDNGIGIKEEVKAKLFNHNFTSKKHGHGYGLVTCNKIIVNHNAKVDIQSEYGKGAIFTIKFPLTYTDDCKN